MSDVPLDHREAYEQAFYKRANSNLARCYLALREELNTPPVSASEPSLVQAAQWMLALIDGGEQMPKPGDEVAEELRAALIQQTPGNSINAAKQSAANRACMYPACEAFDGVQCPLPCNTQNRIPSSFIKQCPESHDSGASSTFEAGGAPNELVRLLREAFEYAGMASGLESRWFEEAEAALNKVASSVGQIDPSGGDPVFPFEIADKIERAIDPKTCEYNLDALEDDPIPLLLVNLRASEWRGVIRALRSIPQSAIRESKKENE
jgi:hypothetical protein